MHHAQGSDWTPGQPIKFAGPIGGASVGGGGAANGTSGASVREQSPAKRERRAMLTPHRTDSLATSRATYNSSPNSSLDVSGDTSWTASHRWEPPSPTRTSIGDFSPGSTAAFSHSRSYAKDVRSVGGTTLIDSEVQPDETKYVEESILRSDEHGLGKVDVAVQTDTSLNLRPLGPAPSKAELDDLVAGIDFEDDSLDFDLGAEPTSATTALSTSTPQHMRIVQLTQPEVEDLVAGIDFSQDFEMSDLEDESRDTYHSAVASPDSSLLRTSSTSVPRPRLRSPPSSVARLPATPRIVFRSPRQPASPSPPPVMPPKPDVFTLSSTPPPRIPSASKNPRLPRTPRSSPLVLSSSPRPPHFPSPARPFSTSQISCDSDESLVDPSKLKGWETVVQSIESTRADCPTDDSVEIIETQPVSKKTDKGKGRMIAQKENEPVSNTTKATATKPGYFARPAHLKPSNSASSTTVPTSLARSSSNVPETALPTASAASRKPREPQRESFKGRNADERYKSAYKQYKLQLKWPSHFDYTTWGRGDRPSVVFTTDEKVVDETLAKLSGPTGFDLEWDMFDTRTRGQGKTALVQVCDQQTILLVQVARMKSELTAMTFPKSLKSFIEDPSKIKLGVQIAGDARKLERDFGFKPKGLLELNDLTKRYDPQQHVDRTGPLIGLQELVGIYLDRYLPKDHSVRCGVWSGTLSDAQKSYGANDVYSSLHVLLALESLISSSTGASLNLHDFTTSNSRKLAPLRSSGGTTTSTMRTGSDARPVPVGLASLAPRKLEAYQLFQVEKLSLKEVTSRMSATNAIKSTSVLWNLLGIYSALEKEGSTVEWDESRLVEAVDSLGNLFTGKMAAEHGGLVKGLREKLKT
ncbi:hypothetical protein JCM11491_000198 [Sporobolomyces phaffii]